MLSSIHPLGERARNNRFALTVGAFTVAAIGTGAVAGALLGWIGGLLPPGDWRWTAALVAVAGAGVADALRLKPPGPHRQVDKDWIGQYRGWVYGAGFGAQLGVGVATFVVTWLVWATGLVALLSGSATVGAAIGAAFGLGRSVLPLAAARIDRPSRLVEFTQTMADRAKPAVFGAAVGSIVLAATMLAIGQ